MIGFSHNGETYTVSPLTGWHKAILNSLAMDVLKIMAFHHGVKYDDLSRLIDYTPKILLEARVPFSQFCLTTKGGDFVDYNLTKLQNVPEMFNIWLDLFASDGFYQKWLEAYMEVNKETVDDESQKKEETTG
jgi:hypothetical protein